jgi:hypothetical protein
MALDVNGRHQATSIAAWSAARWSRATVVLVEPGLDPLTLMPPEDIKQGR